VALNLKFGPWRAYLQGMSVSSIETKIAPLSGRFPDSRVSSADLVQIVAWAALTVVFLAYAIAESSIGAAVFGALVLTQVYAAWTNAHSRELNPTQDTLVPAELS
jgi:hypothetical protein